MEHYDLTTFYSWLKSKYNYLFLLLFNIKYHSNSKLKNHLQDYRHMHHTRVMLLLPYCDVTSSSNSSETTKVKLYTQGNHLPVYKSSTFNDMYLLILRFTKATVSFLYVYN